MGRRPKPKPEEVTIDSSEVSVPSAQPDQEYAPRTDGLLITRKSVDWLQRMPDWVDDLDRKFGLGVKKRMVLDPQISASVNLKANAVLSTGFSLRPAIQDMEHPDYEMSKMLFEFCSRNIERLDTPVEQTLGDMVFDCFAFGNKVAEQTWELQERGIDDGKLMLKSLKTKPHEIYGFVQDPYGNTPALTVWNPNLDELRGDSGNIPGMAYDPIQAAVLPPLFRQGYSPVGAMGQNWKLVPRRKFLVLTHRMKNGDPRGESILTAVYNSWFLLMQVWPEYLKYLAQFATPTVAATAGEKQLAIKDRITGEVKDPVTQLYEVLVKFRNGSALALPHGASAQLLYSQGEGAAYPMAINVFNEQMVKGILYQTLATGEGKHMARAASTTHQDMFNIGVRTEKRNLGGSFRNDVLKPLVTFNYGAQYAHLAPFVSLGETAPEDTAALWSAYATLIQAQGIDETQLQATDALVGLPVRATPRYSVLQQAKLALEEKKQASQEKMDKASVEIQKKQAEAPPPEKKPAEKKPAAK